VNDSQAEVTHSDPHPEILALRMELEPAQEGSSSLGEGLARAKPRLLLGLSGSVATIKVCGV
jgi:hypothetical protein